MDLPLQVKLLRVIQWGEFTPVGGVHAKRAEARIIAATNRNLNQLLQEGKFRPDLYYRLNVLCLELPPLRKRREDIPVLCAHFLKLHSAKLGFAEAKMNSQAQCLLNKYDFPGNIRELENLIMRAILLARGDTIQIHHLPLEILSQNSNGIPSENILDWPFAEAKDKVVSDFERQYLLHQLKTHRGVVLRAARDAGMYEANFRRKMDKYGIVSQGDESQEIARAPHAKKLGYTSQKA